MTVQRCQFCPAVATGVVKAEGLARPILYCDRDTCWLQAYDPVRRANRIPRSWGPLPRPRSARRARAAGQGDLFDLLERGSTTA